MLFRRETVEKPNPARRLSKNTQAWFPCCQGIDWNSTVLKATQKERGREGVYWRIGSAFPTKPWQALFSSLMLLLIFFDTVWSWARYLGISWPPSSLAKGVKKPAHQHIHSVFGRFEHHRRNWSWNTWAEDQGCGGRQSIVCCLVFSFLVPIEWFCHWTRSFFRGRNFQLKMDRQNFSIFFWRRYPKVGIICSMIARETPYKFTELVEAQATCFLINLGEWWPEKSCQNEQLVELMYFGKRSMCQVSIVSETHVKTNDSQTWRRYDQWSIDPTHLQVQTEFCGRILTVRSLGGYSLFIPKVTVGPLNAWTCLDVSDRSFLIPGLPGCTSAASADRFLKDFQRRIAQILYCHVLPNILWVPWNCRNGRPIHSMTHLSVLEDGQMRWVPTRSGPDLGSDFREVPAEKRMKVVCCFFLGCLQWMIILMYYDDDDDDDEQVVMITCTNIQEKEED